MHDALDTNTIERAFINRYPTQNQHHSQDFYSNRAAIGTTVPAEEDRKAPAQQILPWVQWWFYKCQSSACLLRFIKFGASADRYIPTCMSLLSMQTQPGSAHNLGAGVLQLLKLIAELMNRYTSTKKEYCYRCVLPSWDSPTEIWVLNAAAKKEQAGSSVTITESNPSHSCPCLMLWS